MAELRAIETRYKGYRFRSRLEAKWAVFFDALGIEWEYEKEGYDLGEAGWYLPDFWLPSLDAWAEVKSGNVAIWREDYPVNLLPFTQLGEYAKAASLAALTRKSVWLCRDFSSMTLDERGCGPFLWSIRLIGRALLTFDNGYSCLVGTALDDPIATEIVIRVSESLPTQWRSERVLAAVQAARSARFEHGESGAG